MNPCGSRRLACIQLQQQTLHKFGVVWGFILITVTVLQLMSLGFPELIIHVDDSGEEGIKCLCSHFCSTWWSRLSPCSPWALRRADLHAQPGRSPRCSSGRGLEEAKAHGAALGWSCSHGEQPAVGAEARGAASHGTCVEQCLTDTPHASSRAGAGLGALQPVGSSHRISSGFSSTLHGGRQWPWRSSRDETLRTDHSPIPCPSCSSCGEVVEVSGVKLSLESRGCRRKVGFF